jgi:hypothetical protein
LPGPCVSGSGTDRECWSEHSGGDGEGNTSQRGARRRRRETKATDIRHQSKTGKEIARTRKEISTGRYEGKKWKREVKVKERSDNMVAEGQ